MQTVAVGQEVVYAGFFERFAAVLIDGVILVVLNTALRMVIAGPSAIVAGVAFGIAFHIFFWTSSGQTPGKALMSVRVVDAQTGTVPNLSQAILRYIGYWISGLALCIGYLWALVDSRHQTWHDKIAGTVVIRVK